MDARRKSKQELLAEIGRLEQRVSELESREPGNGRPRGQDELLQPNYQQLIDSLETIVWECDPVTTRFHFVSKEAERLLGYPAERWVNEPNFWQDHIHPEDRDRVISECRRATEGLRNHELFYRMLAADGREVWLRDIVSVEAVDGQPQRLRGVMVDVTELVASERALRLLLDVTAAAGEAPDITSATARCLEAICKLRNWEVGQAWFPSEAGDTLVCCEAAYYSTIPVPQFRKVSLELAMAAGIGLPGRVWSSGSPAWICDVTKDSNFPRAVWAEADGLKAAFAFPVKHGDRVYAILEFFTRDAQPPDAHFLDAVEKLGSHLSIVFEQKAAEQELRQARRQLELKVAERTRELEEANIFFSLSIDLFCIGRLDGTILRANQAFQRVFGFMPEEVVGRKVLDFVHPEDKPAVAERFENLGQGQEVVSHEVRCLCKDGTYKWILWSSRPFPEKGVYYAVGHDIDARKQAEQELLESERLHTQILDAVSDMILSKDASSRIVYANKAFRDFYGMSMEELRGIIDAPFNEPGYTQQYLADDAYVFSTGNTLNIPQEPVTRHDGQVRLFHTIKSPIFGADGRVVLSVGVSRDITEQKENEERIGKLNADLEHRVNELAAINRELETLTHKLEVSRDQALETSKLKSEFVANISHEIRTPITGVVGMTELLLDMNLTDEQRNFALAIRDSAESLLAIINDILDFSKMEAGKVELEVIDFSPVSLVEGCAELIAPTAREKKLSLLTYIDPSLPPLLRGDPVRLRQVLLNLASNAVKFTEQGEVVLRALLESTGESHVGIRFIVSDTGIGLPESARQRLFQPFVQADGSTTRKFGGTGLGLSICRRLVELMDGEIGVESEEGRGSTFWVRLRLEKSDLSEPTAASFLAAAGAELQDLKILVATDSDTTCEILRSYLNAAGIVSQGASSAGEAIKSLKSKQFDLAVIDLVGSGADSYSLARTIRLDPALSDTRLVVLSAYEEKGRSDELVKEGFSVFLTKPVRQAQFMDAIARVMKRPGAIGARAAGKEAEKPEAGQTPVSAGRLILVAEDNPVLQELAVLQLKKLGFSAHAVSNGKEAVEAVIRTPYALVLMDCQMPGMDGFDATLAIRKNETITGQHIPIIAMTASAMRGDREHCLTSGMDDYLAKPVTLEQLRAALERWIPSPPLQSVPASLVKEQASLPPAGAVEFIDIERLMQMYGGEALKEILHLFVRETRHLLTEAQFAIKREDGRTLATVAHQLKGLSAVMSAYHMEQLSRELEAAGREGSWEQAACRYQDLEQGFAAVTAAVSTLM
ncbi:MAG TPA: PAS domain S-box protein [Candidatus Obscuribacterales bacterium]